MPPAAALLGDNTVMAEPSAVAPHDGVGNEGQQEAPLQPTSRICVKNLPKYVDEQRMREHFAAKGEVTDSKVMRTRDGKSRCFGFVGFRTSDEAAAAVRYFNRSFMDTLQLVVEFAYKFGSGEVPRAWSKYTAGTSAHRRAAAPEKTGANAEPLGAAAEGKAREQIKKGKKKGQEEARAEEEDPKLREFLQVMQPRNKQAIWANDDLAAQAVAPAAGAAAGRSGKAAAAGGAGELVDTGGSDDEYDDLPGATPSSSDAEEGGNSDEEQEEEAEEGAGVRDPVVADAGVSNLAYLRSRVRANFDDDDEAFAAGGAGAAGEAGSSGSEGEEEEGEGGSSSGDEEEAGEDGSAGAAPSGSDSGSEGDGGQPQAAAAAAPASKQQQAQRKGRRRGEDAADDDMDAIFGAGRGPAGGQEDDEDEEMGEGGSGSESEGGGSDAAPSGSEGGDDADDFLPSSAAAAAEVVDATEEASIADTGRLFVRNLPYTAGEADLQELFAAHGEVSEVHIVLDRNTKKSKGFALVQFASAQDAVAAHSELDGSIFMGRLLHILPGKAPPPPPEAAEEGEGGAGGSRAGSSFKETKGKQLKASAGNRAAWNTLFMRSDTVAEAVAAHYGVKKSELLDREAGDMAVRMALGETHVIAETKRALGEAGADVSKLEEAAAAGGKAAASRAVARSDCVLLVKNLPWTSQEAELETMFGAIGPLGRLVLPPTRTLALVEFLEPQDARRAFKALAYKRYQHVPLYLEWAPSGIFSGPPPTKRQQQQQAAATAAKAKPAAPTKAAAAAATAAAAAGAPGELLTGVAGAEDGEVESSSLYVKNLSFSTSDEALRKHFDAAVSAAGGALRSVKVARRKGPDGKLLSSGFGFVECSSESAAKAALRALQSSMLDGHRLVLQLSMHKAAAAGGDAKGGKQQQQLKAAPGAAEASKVVVRNVAFEATRKDILGLFMPFGAVKSCRLPRKFDGTHRGFAFVDFATKQEAKSAIEAVSGVHLYGRRLVIEWAEEEGGLDELRAKTAAKYRGELDLDVGGAAAEPEAPTRGASGGKRGREDAGGKSGGGGRVAAGGSGAQKKQRK